MGSYTRKRCDPIMRQSIRLGSIAGIPVGLNWGLLLIAAFYIFNLAAGILPAAVPGASTSSYWIAASIGIFLFFGSILAHELGHALVAQRNGIKVNAITLWFLGGVALLDKEADNPGAEFRIAIAGPAVSVALGALFGGLWLVASPMVGGTLFTFILGYLSIVNIGLAIFNMLPAAPLDGGRVLAAALWWRSGNKNTARANAAKAGEVVGTGFMGLGLLLFFIGGNGFITIFLGWFIRNGARHERQRAERQERVTTADLRASMQPLVAPINRGITVSGLEALSGAYDKPVAFPIAGPNGPSGIVSSISVHTTRPEERPHVFIAELIVPWDQFTSARVGEQMETILERARNSGKDHVLVYDEIGQQVGYVALNGFLSAAH